MGTVPVPYTPVAGDDATQARVLTWSDAALYLLGSVTSGGSKRPLCKMRQTVATAFPTTGVANAVAFDTEDVDYDNGHSTVTNTSRYTAATAGWHEVKYGIGFASNITGQRACYLRVNGTTAVAGSGEESQAVNGDITVVNATTHVFLNAGDFLELMGYQNSGGSLNSFVTNPQYQPFMSIEWRSN